MTRSSHKPLLLLNAGLLVALALLALTPGVQARQAANRPHGQYTMVSVEVQGQVDRAIVVVDSANQQMAALRWDRSRKVLNPIGYRDIAADNRMREKQGR